MEINIDLFCAEEKFDNIKFNIHKLSDRNRPDKKDILIVSSFSEFGCETVGVFYTIPQILSKNDKYRIIVGWSGRKYFYEDLFDEYWEIDESFMSLRNLSISFCHESSNLFLLEHKLKNFGEVVTSADLGRLSISAFCKTCNRFWETIYQNGDIFPYDKCPFCNSKDVVPPIISKETNYWKKLAKRIPDPSQQKMKIAESFVQKPSVGIFARGRTTYGRNLQPEFYIKLINYLKKIGYNPIWLGEKVSIQPCPVDDIVDFSTKPESKDLEITLAVIKQCEFTIQFFTASTRLSAMMGIPYILFESPDQINGKLGQEGIRRNLMDFGPSKLVMSEFSDILNDQENAMQLVERSILEVTQKNFKTICKKT